MIVNCFDSSLSACMIFFRFVIHSRRTKFLENFAKHLKGLTGHWCSHLGPVNRTETAVLKVFLGILGWDLVWEPLTRLLKALKFKIVVLFCMRTLKLLMLTCFKRTKAVLLISSRATLALKASCKALCKSHFDWEWYQSNTLQRSPIH